jgi:hypothetical protein
MDDIKIPSCLAYEIEGVDGIEYEQKTVKGVDYINIKMPRKWLKHTVITSNEITDFMDLNVSTMIAMGTCSFMVPQ